MEVVMRLGMEFERRMRGAGMRGEENSAQAQ